MTFPNCKIYLIPDEISNLAQIFTEHVTLVNNSRTLNNRRCLTKLSPPRIHSRNRSIFCWINFRASLRDWNEFFLQFPVKIRNINFSRSRKFPRKKYFDFFESMLKRKPKELVRKLVNGKTIFLILSGQIWANVIF